MVIIRLRRQVNVILSNSLLFSLVFLFPLFSVNDVIYTRFVTGPATSSVESFATDNHQVSQANMQDPMADFLNEHQNMNENVKICKVTLK